MLIGQRIKELIKQEDLTQDAFSLKTGVTRQTINNAVNGKNEPSGEVLSKILIAFPNLNARWLITGEGFIYDKAIPPGSIIKNDKILYANEPQENYQTKLLALKKENARLTEENKKFKEDTLKLWDDNNKLHIELIKCKDEIIEVLKRK